jgi:GntR family transcriptional regulator
MTIAAKWFIDFSSGIPAYRQIINYIYTAIGDGVLQEGERLPTIKELTEQLNVNPNTITRAYRELDLKGVITRKRGTGSFISMSLIEPPKLTAKQTKTKLDELFGRMIAEAKDKGIMENQLMEYMQQRMKEQGQG